MASMIFGLKRIFLKLLLFAIFLATPIIGLAATTYYVSPTGSDSNPGTLASPWKTLAKAVSSVSSGDTVYLRAGTWNEGLKISSKSYTSRTTFARYPSDPAGSAILNGTGIQNAPYEDGVIYIYHSNNVCINGLKVINGYKTGIAIIGSLGSSAQYIEVLNCITDTTVRSGIATWFAQNCTIRSNTIYNSNMPAGSDEILSICSSSRDIDVSYNTLYAGNRTFGATGGEGLNIKDGCSYIYVHHNYVDMARPDGKESDRYAMGVDGWTHETHHIYFYNNIIKNGCWGLQYNSEEGGYTHHIYGWNNIITHIGYGNRGYGGGIGMPNYGNTPGKCDYCYWWNNTVYDCYYGAYFTKTNIGAPIEARNNIFANCGQAVVIRSGVPTQYITLDHNITSGDPRFVNASGGNFHLQSDSPAINAGIAVSEVTDDFDGNSRPQGGLYDIGAYEYTGSSYPPTANANAVPTSGPAPLSVDFSGSATGGTPPYSYRWTFGDGGSSTSQNPSHTYLSVGTYTATLTVTDSKNATSSKSLTISVTGTTSPLVANASASPSSGRAPLTVNFTASASGGTSPYSYRWTFGDGGSSTAQNPSHTYLSVGTYSAALTVTDSKNATSSKSLTITVTATPSQLVATASADPTSGQAPLTVNFTGGGTGGSPPYSYNWNFGDGSSSSVQSPSHTYSGLGVYTVIFTVTDSSSANSRATLSISVQSPTVANLALAAETGAPAPGEGGTTDPSPGNYSFSIGGSASVKSISYTDYRFSKWTGDIADSSTFSSTVILTIDKNKSLSATFCTKCADVNGDLKITPGDAQLAFDIYLGRIANPTWCELENADVNCSGTKLSPKVTPADAQMIFHKFLRKGVTSSDCSGNSRAAALSMPVQVNNLTRVSLTVNDITLIPGQDILVPIIIESPSEITAFGFDLAFLSDVLTYIGLESTDLTKDYEQLDANVISPQSIYRDEAKSQPSRSPMSSNWIFASKLLMPQALDIKEPLQAVEQPSINLPDSRILRVGGYKTNPGVNPFSGVLVTLIFRVIGVAKEASPISVIATYDDLQDASIRNGMINQQKDSQIRENQSPRRSVEKKAAGKRTV
jgi:PKD repeat protein